MAKACGGCRFYTPDGGPTVCPRCGGGLTFTLLDPAAAPLDLGPRPAPPARPAGMPVARLALPAAVVVVAVGLAAAGWVGGRGVAGRIRPGMTAAEVQRVLAADRRWAPPAGTPGDAPVPRDGQVRYETEGLSVTVTLRGGRVAAVDEKPRPGSGTGRTRRFMVTGG